MKAEEIREKNKQRLAEKREKLLANKELGKPIAELSTQISRTNEQIDSLIKVIPEAPKSMDVSNLGEIKAWLNEVVEAVEKIEVSPQVNVSQPDVIIPPIDLSPVITAINKLKTKTVAKLDLSNFRAQDLDEEEEGVQYIGFTNPEGQWFIIRNDMEENKLRYAFGKKDYNTAFQRLSTHNYTTLDEATNAL